MKLMYAADEAYNQVPYEKVSCLLLGIDSTDTQGSNFLLHLERTVGGLDHFLPYMKDYVKTFNGKSITTEQWRTHLFHFFENQSNGQEYLRALGKVDFDEVSWRVLVFRAG